MLHTALHPSVSAAAEGVLPKWAVASGQRREHMERVAMLLESWAEDLGLSEEDQFRWQAVGYLHDSLRDERPEVLREIVPDDFRHLDGTLLHGPAAAELLQKDGLTDGEMLSAIAFHSIGSPGLKSLGRALYAADFLEPGRGFSREWRAQLREQMPNRLDDVLVEIIRARLNHQLERGSKISEHTIAFWNGLISS
ncbi:MAG: HD domain-containing protein [Gemmatimonadetes bacterium]|nr:HD domain-containing protein [Gemmatimonadota bacterium]